MWEIESTRMQNVSLKLALSTLSLNHVIVPMQVVLSSGEFFTYLHVLYDPLNEEEAQPCLIHFYEKVVPGTH